MFALTLAERVAKGPVSASVSARPQPRGNIHRQHESAVRRSRQRHPGQGSPQPGDIDPALVEAAVQSPVTTTVLRREREIDKNAD